MFNIIEYVLKTEDNRVAISEDGRVRVEDVSLNSYLEKLANARLSTLAGRIKAIRRVFGFDAKAPLYLGQGTLFLVLYGIRSPRALLVNVYAINCYKPMGQGLVISFRNGHEMLFCSFAIFRKAFEKAGLLIEWLQEANIP